MAEATDSGTPSGAQGAAGSPSAGQVAEGAGGNPSDVLMIGPDGTFLPGWKDKYVPEDLRADKVFDGTPNVSEMAKMLGNVQRMIGKKGIIMPGEGAAPSEMDAFYKALGRPDKPDGYKIDKPADLPDEYWDETYAGQAKELFHKIGLTPKQAAALSDFNNSRLVEGTKFLAAEEARAVEEATIALKAEWGEAYDERLHVANKLIADNVPDGPKKDAILKRIGNDPHVAEFLANVGMKFEEHRLIAGGDDGRSGAMTPAQAQLRIEELAATPDFATGKLMQVNPAAAKRIQSEMEACAKVIQTAREIQAKMNRAG